MAEPAAGAAPPADNVYAHFDRIGEKNATTKRYEQKCKYCPVSFPHGVSKQQALVQHLALRCKQCPAAVKTTFANRAASSVPSPTAPASQGTRVQSSITSHCFSGETSTAKPAVKLSRKVVTELDHKLLRWAVMHNIPFHALGSLFFLDFITSLQPRYSPPSENRAAARIIWGV